MRFQLPGLAFLGLSVIVLSVACQKDKDGDTAPQDYNPTAAGSTWTYQTNLGQTYTLTATDRDTTALGRSYRVYTSSNGINQYRTKSGIDYYRFGMVPGLGTQGFEEIYLKENQSLNAIWQQTQNFSFPGAPLPLVATLKYTIKGKDLTRTVSGKSFTGVTHVRLDISVLGIGSVGGGDFYYALGVGMIENSMLITAQGQTLANTSEVLTSYSIK